MCNYCDGEGFVNEDGNTPSFGAGPYFPCPICSKPKIKLHAATKDALESALACIETMQKYIPNDNDLWDESDEAIQKIQKVLDSNNKS